MQERFSRSLTDKLSSAQPRVFPAVEDDDQSILDQHVSRVFSPYLSPGTISPKHLHRFHHRSNEMSTSMPDFGKRTNNLTNRLINKLVFVNFSICFSSVIVPMQLFLKLYATRNRFRNMHQLDCSEVQRRD